MGASPSHAEKNSAAASTLMRGSSATDTTVEKKSAGLGAARRKAFVDKGNSMPGRVSFGSGGAMTSPSETG